MWPGAYGIFGRQKPRDCGRILEFSLKKPTRSDFRPVGGGRGEEGEGGGQTSPPPILSTPRRYITGKMRFCPGFGGFLIQAAYRLRMPDSMAVIMRISPNSPPPQPLPPKHRILRTGRIYRRPMTSSDVRGCPGMPAGPACRRGRPPVAILYRVPAAPPGVMLPPRPGVPTIGR